MPLEKIVTGDWNAKLHVDFYLPLHVDCGHQIFCSLRIIPYRNIKDGNAEFSAHFVRNHIQIILVR
jgi:hypothetical protein